MELHVLSQRPVTEKLRFTVYLFFILLLVIYVNAPAICVTHKSRNAFRQSRETLNKTT